MIGVRTLRLERMNDRRMINCIDRCDQASAVIAARPRATLTVCRNMRIVHPCVMNDVATMNNAQKAQQVKPSKDR